MATKRLVPHTVVAGWDNQLAAAARDAWAAQEAQIRSKLAQIGVGPSSLVAAATRRPRGRLLGVWSGAAISTWVTGSWAGLVGTHVAPVASRLSGEADTYVAGQVPAGWSWGNDAGTVARAATIIGVAVTAGNYIGQRLQNAVNQPDPADAVAAVLLTAADILGDVVGSQATMLAGSASLAVLQNASQQGLLTTEATITWNAIGDDSTREWHLDADGQTVPVGEPFDVDGESLLYPGDPGGSDENVLNCRCYCSYDGISADDSDDSGDASE